MVDDILGTKYVKLCKLNDIQIISNEARGKAHLNLIDKEDIEYLISVQHPWILSLDILESVSGGLLTYTMRSQIIRDIILFLTGILSGEVYHATTIHWISKG